MKHFLLSLALALLLGGCTGSFEERPRAVLIVGWSPEAGAGAVALFEDRSLEGRGEEGIMLLEGSVRALPAPPVAFDVVDRDFARSELVVLSRDEDLGIVSRFSLAGINPDATDAQLFQPLGEPLPLDLGTLAVAPTVSPPPTSLCPVKIAADNKVLGSGRSYLAVLSQNQGGPCNNNDPNAIEVIELSATGEATIVAHLEGNPFPLLASAFYLDQDGDLLYYFTRGPGTAQLQAFSLATLEAVPVEVEIPLAAGATVRDFGPVLDEFIVLLESSFVPLPSFSEGEFTVISTNGNSRELILDDFKGTRGVLILSRDRLTVHRTTEDEEEQSVPLSDPVDGTIESLNQFAYIVSEARITRFDVLLFESGFSSDTLESYPVPEIQDPAFISWVQALPLAP